LHDAGEATALLAVEQQATDLQCQQWFQGGERRWREHNDEMMKSNPVVSMHQNLADIALGFLGGSWRNKRLAHQAWYEVSLGLAGLTRPP
jgi:hypothetical protein